uniref:Uncharacterized protein n=1 Tax=Sinocyclocheilus rhinocerous TaxID=307959 RepID=A0A673MFJ4_9TELE
VVPFPVVYFFVDGTGFGGARAHVEQKVQVAVQHLNGEEIHLQGFGALGVFLLLRFGFSVAEEEKAVGLSGAEVEGDGTGFFGGPLVKGNE